MIHLFHEWKAVAMMQRNQPLPKVTELQINAPPGTTLVYPKTDVLYQCKCGKLKSQELDGRWTMEQIDLRQ